MTMQCIIVDDEPLALELLEDNISKVPFLDLVAKCANAMEATEILKDTPVDLVFTDIQMPGLSGMQFVETLTEKPMFIFITAYEKYALEGYKLDIVDYLVKPVSFDRFMLACNKAYERYSVKKTLAEKTAGNSDRKNNQNYIFVHVDYSLVKIVLTEVKFIEAKRDYIKFHFIPGNKPSLLVRMSMKNIEAMLPADVFLRIHKSYIINTDSITAIRKNSIFIDDLEFVVSEQYKSVLDRFK